MRIPLPCRFGESALCNGRFLPLVGATWFRWTKGMEYTYFFKLNDKWHDTDFYSSFQNKQYNYFEIPVATIHGVPKIYIYFCNTCSKYYYFNCFFAFL